MYNLHYVRYLFCYCSQSAYPCRRNLSFHLPYLLFSLFLSFSLHNHHNLRSRDFVAVVLARHYIVSVCASLLHLLSFIFIYSTFLNPTFLKNLIQRVYPDALFTLFGKLSIFLSFLFCVWFVLFWNKNKKSNRFSFPISVNQLIYLVITFLRVFHSDLSCLLLAAFYWLSNFPARFQFCLLSSNRRIRRCYAREDHVQ